MNKPPILCDKCDSNFSCLLDYDGENCRKIRSVEPTYADSIRAMTDEELADFMILFSDYVPNPDGKRRKDCWLDWLKQEVKDV